MSMVPRLFNYHLREALRPRRFGMRDPFAVAAAEMNALLDRMTTDPHVGIELEESAVGKDGFQVHVDVQQFKPSEITVKTVDNTVHIEGKHEERRDGSGFISRHFVRRYTLPAGFDPAKVVSSLSSDGVLTVKVPPPMEALGANERIVEIHQTGPAEENIKKNPPIENKTDKK